MSTATTSRTAAAPAAPVPTGARTTPWGVLRAEWIKLWSLRSTYWTLGLTVVVMVLLAWAVAGSWSQVPEGTYPGTDGSAMFIAVLLAPGPMFGSLVLVVLGAMTITGEYSTGQVRSTFAAVPTRLPVLAAKAVVVAVVGFVAAALGTAGSLLLGGAVNAALQPDWSDPEMLRIVLGTPLFIATIGLLGFAVGALLRNTAASISTVIGMILLVENILNLLTWKVLEYVRPLLPATAGSRLTTPQEMLDMASGSVPAAVELSPWGGYGVLVAWVVVILVAAAVRLRTRDV